MCGKGYGEAPAPEAPVVGLEASREPVAEVPVERMPELVTTVEEIGEVLINDVDDLEETPPRRCRSCGVPNSADRIVCIACGVRL